MKNLYFVGKRFAQAFAPMFAVLIAVYIARGQQPGAAAQDAALWSGIAAILFACTVLYNRTHNKPCALCRDEPG